MHLITAYELADWNDNELTRLFRDVSRELARTAPQTIERSTALASLENIERARTHGMMCR